MPKTNVEKQRRRSEAKRKATDDHLSSDRPMKRKLNEQPGAGQKEHQATAGLSDTELFKIRYAAEFDDEAVRESGSQTDVKQEEQQDIDDTATESTHSISTELAVPAHRARSPPVLASSQDAFSARDLFQQDHIFVTILSQGSWDVKMTQLAVDNLARRAQLNATPGRFFDEVYTTDLVTLLDNAGIEAERRAQVIAMLRASLREPLAQWTLRIDQLGMRSLPPAPHDGVGATSRESNPPDSGPAPSTSRLLYVDIGQPLMDETATAWDSSFQERAFSSSSDESSVEDQRAERQDQRLHSRIDPQHLVALPSSSTATRSNAAYTTKSQHNLRVYGTRQPKAPFDVFAMCVISIWALAAKPEDDSVKIRAYARSKWPPGGKFSEQRAQWQKLHDVRHEPDIDVPKLGRQLLLAQDLLNQVVPGDRLETVKIQISAPRAASCELRDRRSPLPEKFAPLRSPLSRSLGYSHASQEANPEIHASIGHNNRSRQRSHLRIPVYTAGSAISQYFPRLVQATSTVRMTQACFVPCSTRDYDPNGCLFMLNTPDTNAGRIITEPDVRLACVEAQCKGLKDVTRHNNNVFVVSFETRTNAWQAYSRLKLHFAISSAGATSRVKSSLKIPASLYVQGPHHVFRCSLKISLIKQGTIYDRVFEALHGPRSASFQLLKQDGTEGWVRYLLRRPASASPIHVERFYIPVDRASGFGMTWAIFTPVETSLECRACHDQCQAGTSSTCPYAVLMSKP